jgi:hypothetical protein
MGVVTGASPGAAFDRNAFDSMIRIIRAEFHEMPGMRLTRSQFRRLWHLTDVECERLLSHLLGTGFLKVSGQGWFGRPPDL